jgi:hypothetical protein
MKMWLFNLNHPSFILPPSYFILAFVGPVYLSWCALSTKGVGPLYEAADFSG